jgi:uncharacterized cupredoxin-like copper-binding protein
VLLAGLTTGHKIGIGVAALVFISFALLSSFYAPRRRPDFPGKNGLSVFVVVSLALFAAMVSAIVVFGRESEAKGAGEKAAAKTIAVRESEYKIRLASSTVAAGPIAFDVSNAGRIPHDLTIQGSKATPSIAPGKSATLTVTLKPGTYTLYCSVPGHRKLGMVAKLTVT